ncbi:hypothetical protein AN958_05577 [Leucoagaricus sp. SymC.cos]|nr:hypothetical protein AN958_05577 [Leucoagaricus sp. SymC.cos]
MDFVVVGQILKIYVQVLGEPLTNKQRSRASGYLSHIQNFYFQAAGPRETSLWPMLAASLDISATASLLPNLRSLVLDLGNSSPGIGSWLHMMTPLFSLSLQRITYSATSRHVGGVESFQTLLKSQSNVELVHVKYQGYPSPNILQRFFLFQGLESLSLDFFFEGQAIQRYTQSTVAIADIFDQFPRLRDLKIDLRLFPLRDSSLPDKHVKVAASPVLCKLHVTGDANDLQAFLVDGVTSSSLLSLTLSLAQVNGLVWKVLCDQAAANFPNVNSLILQLAQPNTSVPQLLLQDISSFISRSTMRLFYIDTIPHCFADNNIAGLVNSWPRLRALSILNNFGIHFSATVLTELCQLPYLEEVALPLNLSDLETHLPLMTPLTNCPLKSLRVTGYSVAPTTLDGKIDLARNILMLFPAIQEISSTSTNPSQQVYLGELHKLIQAFHSTIAIQAHRAALRRQKFGGDPRVRKTAIKRDIGIQWG